MKTKNLVLFVLVMLALGLASFFASYYISRLLIPKTVRITVLDQSTEYRYTGTDTLKTLDTLLTDHQFFAHLPFIRGAKAQPSRPINSIQVILTDTPQKYTDLAWNEPDGTLYMAINLGSQVIDDRLETRLYIDPRLRQTLNTQSISRLASQQLIRHLLELRYRTDDSGYFDQYQQQVKDDKNSEFLLTIE